MRGIIVEFGFSEKSVIILTKDGKKKLYADEPMFSSLCDRLGSSMSRNHLDGVKIKEDMTGEFTTSGLVLSKVKFDKELEGI